jgi:hypothetical protein
MNLALFGRGRPSLDTRGTRLARAAMITVSAAALAGIAVELQQEASGSVAVDLPSAREIAFRGSQPADPVPDNEALVARLLARPLFTAGRRPPAPVPVAALPAAPPPQQPEWRDWRLAGIVVGPTQREALFTRGNEKRPLVEGGEIDGWTLVAVEAGGVTLRAADLVKTLAPEPERRQAAATARTQTASAPAPVVAFAPRKETPGGAQQPAAPGDLRQTRAAFLAAAERLVPRDVRSGGTSPSAAPTRRK